MQIPSLRETIEKVRNKNKRIALIFPIYYPSALLRTFDIHPIEIWNLPNADLSLADLHLQSYTCSLSRILLSFIKEEKFQKDYDLILVPHTCDTFQQIGSLMTDFIKPIQPVINFYLPKRKDELGISFCIDELIRISRLLEDFTGQRLDIDRFTIEINKDIEANNLLKKVLEKREFIHLNDSQFYQIITSRTFLPPEDFITILTKILNSLNNCKRRIKNKIFVSGISIENPELFEIINANNTGIVFDDLAISSRKVFKTSNLSNEPFRRQSEIILFTAPDAEKGSTILEKLEHLQREIKRTDASGGIFYIMKFCEPEYFYYPQIKSQLNKEGIKTFLIEYEMSSKISKQNISRIQAFIESL